MVENPFSPSLGKTQRRIVVNALLKFEYNAVQELIFPGETFDIRTVMCLNKLTWIQQCLIHYHPRTENSIDAHLRGRRRHVGEIPIIPDQTNFIGFIEAEIAKQTYFVYVSLIVPPAIQ